MNSTAPRYVTRTLRVRLKDKHASWLVEQSKAVNTVWNFCNELSFKHWQRTQKFFSAYEMQPYTKGSGKLLGLHSQTVQAIQEEYCIRRKQFKKAKLRWRKSSGSKRSLGWIPFKASAITYRNGQVWYAKTPLSLWDSYGLGGFELGSGSFAEDARGRWYLNITVKKPVKTPEHQESSSKAMGIDLGLSTLVATSDGQKFEAQQFYRDLEPKIAAAQRARKPQRVRALHDKARNRRSDFLHKLSTQLVQECGAIFVGNVSSLKLAKTTMAKSVMDAGWGGLRTMLQYKSDSAGVWFEKVNEAYSTQICSCCGKTSENSPKGRAGLGIREWQCCHCATIHDRDINAARNILAVGHGRLAGGNPGLL